MPILLSNKAVSGTYPDLALNLEKFFFKKEYLINNGIFYLPGKLISLHRLHRSLFVVVNYSFTGYFFAPP
jgi:hypothetical protein